MTQYHQSGNGGDEYYNYVDMSYLHSSLHRRITHYDPRNTTNEWVLQAFRIAEQEGNYKSIYRRLVHSEIQRMENPMLTSLPIGLQMVFHEINLAWVDIVGQMLFVDGLVETFYSEYCNILNNVVYFDTPYAKETMVYRHHTSGESLFHLAGKMWLILAMKKHSGQSPANIEKEIGRQLGTVFSSYASLGKCFGKGMGGCILSLRDFTGKPLKEFLTDYSTEICNSNES